MTARPALMAAHSLLDSHEEPTLDVATNDALLDCIAHREHGNTRRGLFNTVRIGKKVQNHLPCEQNPVTHTCSHTDY